MSSSIFGSPPTPPNPIQTAAAQTSTNVGTALANSYLNNVNQVTPSGNLNYNVTGNYPYTDPASGATYNIPTWTATQTGPTPGTPQYNINQANLAAQTNLAQLGQQQSGQLLTTMAGQTNILDDPNLPKAGDPNSLNTPDAATTFADVGGPQRSIAPDGSQQTTFGDAGDITSSYGPGDFSADRDKVQASLMARINPQLDIQRNRLEQQLADQGIRYGSDAYNNAMTPFNQQVNDAQFSAINQAGTEQQRMMDMAAQRAGFQNAAQKQAYDEAQGRGTFANTAQSQQFQEDVQSGTFANQAQQAAFQQAATRGDFANAGLAQQMQERAARLSAQNTARGTYESEKYAAENQPINQITALLSGSQVASPNFVNPSNTTIPTTDIAGLTNNRFSQDLANYQTSSNNFNQLMGGIFGAIGGLGKGYAASDRNVKENIDKVGTVFAAGPEKEGDLPIYEYSFKDDPASTRHVGPMAQDVEKFDRRAVKTFGGVKHINTTRMGSILKAA